MKLEILHGPAGSGKTARLLETVRQRARAGHSVGGDTEIPFSDVATHWFVVPDQATFITEKRILDTLGDRGGAQVRVFSLNRLARHILSVTGGNARPFLDASGKSVLVYRVISALADELPLFSDAIRKGGFPAIAGEVLAECRRYGISPEALLDVAAHTQDARLAVKLRELALMGEAVAAAMTEGGYLDGEDMLEMASTRLREVPEIGEVHLYVDQFLRFSPVQLQLLYACLSCMASVTVALRLSGDAPTPGLEALLPGRAARQAHAALLKYAHSHGIPVAPTHTDGVDRRHAPGSGLAWLSSRLRTGSVEAATSPAYNRNASLPEAGGRMASKRKTRADQSSAVSSEGPGDVHLAVFPNPEEEVHACATELVRLCREQGCRFRDLAVLVPDTAEYAAEVRRIFPLHDIPFFMDRKASLAGHPVAVALLTPFDILRGGWRHDDVFRLLKTGLLPVLPEVADHLENHALAVGMRGQRMWCASVLEDEALEEVRRLIAEPLTAFRAVMRRRIPIRTALDAYLDLLLAWRIPQTVASQAQMLAEQGELAAAGHMRQLWKSCCALMDQILELGGDGTISLMELHGMLQSGLEGAATGIIPPSLEEVFVGTPSRSQLSEVRHLFVLGVVEGWIPSAPGSQGLLTDTDRQRLRERGLQLAPDTQETGRERRDELDAVLVMSSEGLWLSRPVSDREGRALRPSPLIEELRRMFPGLREGWHLESESGWMREVDWATTPRALLERLAPVLGVPVVEGVDAQPSSSEGVGMSVGDTGTGSMFRERILGLLGDYGELDKPLRRLLAGRHWWNDAALDPEWMRARYGVELYSSISSLEMYRKCPFSWFARHAARLREREESGLQDVGFGLLMHDALEAAAREVAVMGGWDVVTESDLDDILSRVVRESVAKGTGISPLHPGLAAWFAQRLEKAARVATGRVFQQIRGGKFRPFGHELGFGEEGPFPPFALDLPDGGGMRLIGRLDRLDLHEAPDGCYLRVVDYKSGDRSLTLSDIANGLSLQLPAYLAVALESMRAQGDASVPIRPAGIFHMRLEPPDLRMKDGSGTGAAAEQGKRMRLSGYVLDNPSVLEAMDASLSSGGTSSVLKASMNKNGTISSRTKTLSEDAFSHLGELLRDQMGRMGSDMLAGNIPVHPVRTRGINACTFCPYVRVCRFEPGLGGAHWDRPREWTDDAVREILEHPSNGETGHEKAGVNDASPSKPGDAKGAAHEVTGNGGASLQEPGDAGRVAHEVTGNGGASLQESGDAGRVAHEVDG